MKTIVIYDQLDADLKFFVLDGDYKHLDGVYINSIIKGTKKAQKAHDKLQDELSEIVYQDLGPLKVQLFDNFPMDVVQNNGLLQVAVIKAGFLP